MTQRLRLGLECALLFGAAPFALFYLVHTPAADFPIDMGGFEPRRLLFPLLWLFAIAAMWHYKRVHHTQLFPRITWQDVRTFILPRFAVSAAAMVALAFLLEPARFFQFPLERPTLWFAVMLLYPLISVVPQEVLFRLFFMQRYVPLFGTKWPMLLASGLAFGHAHLLFNNSLAYIMSIIGGVFFAMTYARTRNLSLVWLEHSLYGQWVFTVGLGWYFYTGAAASHG